MRGKADPEFRQTQSGGITPAYAGKRGVFCPRTLPCLYHPRLCGEKRRGNAYRYFTIGSPPPMRGKGPCQALRFYADGITPAYAGKSVIDTLVTLPSVGSPPPMRGKAARSSCGLLSRGITPAYAGKSSVDAGDAWKRRDHPRLCGEKGNSKGLRGARWGSPPPMRGKGTPFASSFSPRRITPAYAGKSTR